jgi:hypothetical protein
MADDILDVPDATPARHTDPKQLPCTPEELPAGIILQPPSGLNKCLVNDAVYNSVGRWRRFRTPPHLYDAPGKPTYVDPPFPPAFFD